MTTTIATHDCWTVESSPLHDYQARDLAPYTSHAGEVREHTRCTICGNVSSRPLVAAPVVLADHSYECDDATVHGTQGPCVCPEAPVSTGVLTQADIDVVLDAYDFFSQVTRRGVAARGW